MAISIISRPEKTLDNGYVSRWNASRTPLNYKFNSTKFPVNTFDTPSATQEIGPYDASKRGMRFLTNSMDKYAIGEWLKIENSPVDGIYKVIGKESSSIYYLDFYDSGNYIVVDYPTMSDNQYYKGYKGLVKVFAGAPSYHPYNTDLSKPKTEIGTIEVEFGSNNEGIANVRNFIKPDMSAGFDYNDENSHEAWTSFNIEYTEIWDNQENPIPYQIDILENCTPFVGFTNESFDNGLTDWSQEELVTGDLDFTAGPSQVFITGSGANRNSKILYQDLQLRTNVPYQVEINYNLVSGTVSDNIRFNVLGQRASDDVWEIIYLEQSIPLGTGVGIVDITPTKEFKALGFRFSIGNVAAGSFNFALEYFQVTSSVSDVCEYSSFSIFGAKQFQDSLGGNFGDYIADYQLQGKFLTHFNELTYPYYINSIIPNSTFNRSEGNDSVYLDEKAFDAQGNTVEEVRTKINNVSDGVYTVNSGLTVSPKDWDNGTAQIISIPNNLLLDGDGGNYQDPLNWNIDTFFYSEGTPNQNGAQFSQSTETPVPTGEAINSGPNLLLANAPYKSHIFTTPIQVIQGLTYIVETELYMNAIAFEPSQKGNVEFYLGIEGYNDNDLTFTTAEVPTGNEDEFILYKVSTSFVATTDTIQIITKNTLKQNINNSTGGRYYLKDTTVRGPIEFLTEVKPTKPSSSCSVKYNTPIRWKNDLGGWGFWNFNRYRTFNETVSNRNEIRRDITQDFDNYFINGDSEYDTINMDVRRSVVLRSGLLTENEQIVLNGIRRSIKIQVQLDGVWTTVTTKPSTFLLTDENEYMREVSFEIYLPNTLIQEQ